MDNKDIVISGLVIAILFLIKKNKTSNTIQLKQVELLNNATLLIDKGDQYKATIYSSNPILANYTPNTKASNSAMLQMPFAKANDDYIKNFNQIGHVPYVG